MDEIHIPKTEYYNISTDWNTECAIVEEKEPCSIKLEQSRTEETRAKRNGFLQNQYATRKASFLSRKGGKEMKKYSCW